MHAHLEIMKTPNRNFVVEYKGSRKRGTPQPKSIWGDIDLRSAAKSVEADGLLPKDTPPPSAAEESQIGLGPTLVESAPKASAVEKLVATEAAETFVAVEETFEDQSSLPSQVHGLEQPAADKNTLPPRKARGKDLKPRRRRAQVAAMADAPSKPESGMAWEDELAQLDAENHSLKRELLEKLRAENEALVAMLQRVSATG
ncbi:hypothetical protein AAIH70_26050 [Neorhizobium sp. BT27B]|uniref:hypothetical protein n=1 Tax=Neorhizobium sp. BT27B TaxID=3142625 RepID=UPI003D2B91FE